MKKILLHILPHIIAVIIFITVTAVYFAPQYEGYELNQSDIHQFLGMSKEISDFRNKENVEPLWTNAAFGGMPTYQISMRNPNILTWIEDLVVFKIANAPFGYLLLAMLSFYILLLCFDIDPWLCIVGAVAYGLTSIFVLYLAGGHNSKVHAIALLPGVIAGLIYGYRKNVRMGGLLLCVFLCLHLSANHIQETYYLTYLLFAIVLFEGFRYYKERRIIKFIKISLFLLIAAIIGVVPTLSNLLLTNEYGKYTNRGKSDLTVSLNGAGNNSESKGLDRDYIKEYSMGYGELWSLAIPDVKGGESNRLGNFKDKLKNVAPENLQNVEKFPGYWGEQSGTGGAFYFGSAIFLLFVLGMVFIKDKIKWAFFGISVLAVILSWKYSAILDMFIDYMPLFNKFRDTKMILVLVQISFPLLAMLFLNNLVKSTLDKKKLYYTLAATFGLFLLFYILPTFCFSFLNYDEIHYFQKISAKYPLAIQQISLFKTDIEHVRISIFRDDVLRSMFFMLLATIPIVLFVKKKIDKRYLIFGIGVVVLVDLWNVDKRYLSANTESSSWIKKSVNKTQFSPGTADYQILKWEKESNSDLKDKINDSVNHTTDLLSDNKNAGQSENGDNAFSILNFETDYRVFSLNNPFSSATTSYYHKSIGGYHAAKLKRYAELIEFCLDKEYDELTKVIKTKNDSLINDVLKTKIPVLNMLNTKYIISNDDTVPIRNVFANGSAWFVKDVLIVKDANNEINALENHNLVNTAVVDQFFSSLIPSKYSYDSTAKVKLTHYLPNHLSYISNSCSIQVCVFSEIYYKDGWNAYIDGKKIPYLRVNYVLRALTIPAGKHNIDFRFEPKTYMLSRKLVTVGSILMVLFVLGIIIFEFKRKGVIDKFNHQYI